jgi:spore germination cell wall hydrolase CwlJ-like protein
MGATRGNPFAALDDDKLLALTIYGEARGERISGKCAVGSVIINRARIGGWYGKGIKGVILKPFQFSCFLPNDPNMLILREIALNWDDHYAEDKVLRMCHTIAKGLLDEKGAGSLSRQDITHYKTNKCKASWEDKMEKVCVIGNHSFFKEKA